MSNRNISQAFFEALKLGDIKGKEISKAANVSEQQISRFRRGKDLYVSVLQRLIDALPAKDYEVFLSLLGKQIEPKSDEEIADDIMNLANKLRNNLTVNRKVITLSK